MTASIISMIGVLGLLIGSFLNVVVYRVPAGMSIVAPPSACPRCGHRIRAVDNVPVLSWLVLGGRCRDCSVRIPVRYPAVEALTGMLFAAVASWVLFAGPTTTLPDGTSRGVLFIALLYLMAISVALAFIDLDTHRLPNALTYPSYVVLAILLASSSVVSGDWGAFVRAVLGGIILAAIYLVLAIVAPNGMGLGDVKLSGILGLVLAYLGWGPLAVGGFAAFFVGGTVSIILMLAGRLRWRGGIPFGPSMLLGSWIGIVFGGTIWHSYLVLLGLA